MPIYEYRCQNCHEVFEVRQKFSDEPIATHAVCGGNAQRLLSTPQFHFKGSGFYITDYGKGGNKAPGAKTDGKTEAKAEPKTESKTESKPAATPAASTKTD
ncbi:MAG: zinc ribbon domain-containing protein [Acidobacteria bacterium]|nr:zinc ribbon domain-containing protein [Acidobacteriota bacterium]